MSSASGVNSPLAENYQGRMAWTVDDCIRLNRIQGFVVYGEGGIKLPHATLKEKMVYLRRKCLPMNCDARGYFWQATDIVAKFIILSLENPEISFESQDLKGELMRMYVKSHEEFTNKCLKSLEKSLLSWNLKGID